jgi:hypothetical protein
LGPRASQRDSRCAPFKGAEETATELTSAGGSPRQTRTHQRWSRSGSDDTTDSQKHGATPSHRAIVGRSARVPLRQRAQVKRRALPEPWSEQAAPEPQGMKAQPINTTAGYSPQPLSPRAYRPEGVASAKGWARGSVYSDVGASHAVASVSAQGVSCVLRNSGGACDGARAGHKTPPRALPTSLYTPPHPSHGASLRRAH